jgi:uncharacterized protein YerC
MGNGAIERRTMDDNSKNEILELVEEAHKPGKFNLADAIKDRAYPEKSVVVYTDIVSARELYQLNEKLDLAAISKDAEGYSKLEKEAKELTDKISKSKLTFFMRGLPQDKVDEIGDLVQSSSSVDLSWSKDYILNLVAASIVNVKNSANEVDERVFTAEDAKALYSSLPQESWIMLVEAVEQLTLATGIFKGITDAGFLPKS